jgi:hypothetical protein
MNIKYGQSRSLGIKTIVLYSSLLSSILFLKSCTNGAHKSKNNVLLYENIVIYSDVSSRLKNFPYPNDSLVIDGIIEYFVNDCVKPGVKTNDRSRIAFSRMNDYNSKCGSYCIDIDEIKPLNEKQKFVNNKSKNGNLSDRIKQLRSVVSCVYKEQDPGLDILTLLSTKIESGTELKRSVTIKGMNDKESKIEYSNTIIVLTDGYLEFKGTSKVNYFGVEQIEKVREQCIAEKLTAAEVFAKYPNLCLDPINNQNNGLVNLVVMETADRGFDPKNGIYKYKPSLSDNTILKAAWENWAIQSGFKNFKWIQSTNKALSKDFIKKIFFFNNN